MGGCVCKIDFLDNNQEVKPSNPEIFGNNKGINIDEMTSQNSAVIPESKINEIKNNLQKKLPTLGNFIKMDDFIKVIGSQKKDYITNNKLQYKIYLSQIITYRPDPIQFINGNMYNGGWNSNCEMEGYGLYYLKEEKVVTEGVWRGGNLVFGRIFLPNNDIYEGEISNSVFEGKGTITFSNGERYVGGFSKGEMNGRGTYTFPDKTVYNGSFKNGLFNGKGQMKWVNGTEYEGNFIDSYLSGKGKIFNLQGEKYVGNFDRNEFNGNGEYSFCNGDVYTGNFEYGTKKGKGVYKRNDNAVFSCTWNNDLPDGQGVISYNNNKIKGYWRNGMMIDKPEVEEGTMDNFKGIDLNIKPCPVSLCIISLPHLGNENNVSTSNNNSQYIAGKDLSFL